VKKKEDMDVLPLVPKITSFKEAIQSLEDVLLFLEDRGLFEQASSTSSLIDQVARCCFSSLSQVTLHHYFQPAE
jgi:hypothetical protein